MLSRMLEEELVVSQASLWLEPMSGAGGPGGGGFAAGADCRHVSLCLHVQAAKLHRGLYS